MKTPRSARLRSLNRICSRPIVPSGCLPARFEMWNAAVPSAQRRSHVYMLPPSPRPYALLLQEVGEDIAQSDIKVVKKTALKVCGNGGTFFIGHFGKHSVLISRVDL